MAGPGDYLQPIFTTSQQHSVSNPPAAAMWAHCYGHDVYKKKCVGLSGTVNEVLKTLIDNDVKRFFNRIEQDVSTLNAELEAKWNKQLEPLKEYLFK